MLLTLLLFCMQYLVDFDSVLWFFAFWVLWSNILLVLFLFFIWSSSFGIPNEPVSSQKCQKLFNKVTHGLLPFLVQQAMIAIANKMHCIVVTKFFFIVILLCIHVICVNCLPYIWHGKVPKRLLLL